MLALTGAVMVAAPAGAALVTRTFAFTASNFSSPSTGDAGPVDPVSGSYTVTFDTAGPDINGQTTGITENSLDVPHTPGLAFDYLAGADILLIGNDIDPSGTTSLNLFSFDFLFELGASRPAARSS